MLRIELLKQMLDPKYLAKSRHKWDFNTFRDICRSKLEPNFLEIEDNVLYCGFGDIRGIVYNTDEMLDVINITDVTVVDFNYSPPIVEILGNRTDKKGQALVERINKWLNEEVELEDKKVDDKK